MKKIDPKKLVAMDTFCETEPIRIDMVYAKADHPENIFETAIYRSEARLWLHEDLADIIVRAARILSDEQGWIMVLKDGLRTVEAQAAMYETDIVKANPHWKDGFLSGPGHGAHPRGFAIDAVPALPDGTLVDMGTVFDHLTHDPAINPAARDYDGFSEDVLENRRVFEEAIVRAANEAGHEILPLPQEWWDFRFPRPRVLEYDPIADADLPEDMRMTAAAPPAPPMPPLAPRR